MQRAPRAAPWRTLLALGVGALLVHLALLEAAPVPMATDGPRFSRPLVTRVIEAAPVASPAVAAPPVQTVRVAPPKPARQPARPRTGRSVTPAEALPAAPPAPTPQAQAADDAALPPTAAASAPVTVATNPASTASSTAAVTPPPAESQAAQQPSSYAVPGSVRLRYSVSGMQGTQPLSGVAAELLWLHDGERYEARLAFTLLFRTLRSQTSTGRITPDGIAPDRFSDRRRAEVAAHFERDKGKISFSNNMPDAPLLPGAQDRLSVFFQLAAMLAGAPGGLAPGTPIAVQTAGPRDAESWTFVIGTVEPLVLPVGSLEAVRLVREPRGPYDQKIEAWFAPSLGWAPVRLRITEANGDTADQQLRSSETP